MLFFILQLYFLHDQVPRAQKLVIVWKQLSAIECTSLWRIVELILNILTCNRLYSQQLRWAGTTRLTGGETGGTIQAPSSPVIRATGNAATWRTSASNLAVQIWFWKTRGDPTQVTDSLDKIYGFISHYKKNSFMYKQLTHT